MKPRERVLTALSHEEPDRVPLFYRDVPEVGRRLERDLGVSGRDQLLEYLEIDFRWVEPRYVGPSLEDEATGNRRNVWGVEYRYVEAAHGGHWQPVEFPLATVEDAAALDDHPWPTLDWFDFSVLPEQTRQYDDYGVRPIVPGPREFLLECRSVVEHVLRSLKAIQTFGQTRWAQDTFLSVSLPIRGRGRRVQARGILAIRPWNTATRAAAARRVPSFRVSGRSLESALDA